MIVVGLSRAARGERFEDIVGIEPLADQVAIQPPILAIVLDVTFGCETSCERRFEKRGLIDVIERVVNGLSCGSSRNARLLDLLNDSPLAPAFDRGLCTRNRASDTRIIDRAFRFKAGHGLVDILRRMPAP